MYKRIDKVTVADAAARLGVKEQAIRKRIQRGTIAHEKDEDGRVYVYLDPEEEVKGVHTSSSIDTNIDTLVQSLQEQVEYLRVELQRRGETYAEESRRKDHIIAALTERIPELPPSTSLQEATNGHETASEGMAKGDVPPEPQEPSERRSWWRRFFGL